MIDLIGLRKVHPSESLPSRMYYRGFVDVIEVIQIYAKRYGDLAEVTFDTRSESDHKAALLYANMRETNPGWKECLAPKVSFDCDRNPRLESADLFAREAMKHLDNRIGPKKRPTRKAWTTLRESRRFAATFFGEEHFREMDDEFRAPSSVFKTEPEEYNEWLVKRRRIDNNTNYFEFLNYWWKSRH